MNDRKDDGTSSSDENDKDNKDLEIRKKKFESDFKKILILRKEVSAPVDNQGLSSCIGQCSNKDRNFIQNLMKKFLIENS